MSKAHQSVLLAETIEALAIKPDGTYIDATFGRGGHSEAILKCLGARGRLLAIDKDPEAIAFAEQHFKDKRFSIVPETFGNLAEIAARNDLIGKVDGILFDLGVSSPQLDDAQRGFSFLREGPLDMRMNPKQGISAAKWLAAAQEKEIVQVLFTYGEERYARRIAKAIVKARVQTPITTTLQLAEIVSAAHPAWEKHKHPATRAFQAIRIFINQELEELEKGLTAAVDVLAIGGRLVVISFHSLEDRKVKRFIRRGIRDEDLPAKLPVKAVQMQAKLRSIGRAITAKEEEIAANPRARSARIRIAEKVSGFR